MFAKNTADTHTLVRAGVGVLVRDQRGRILLEKRSDCGLWGLPGGKIAPGESVRSAAEREVKEETGFDVKVTRLIGVYLDPEDRIVTFLDNSDVVHLIDIILEAQIISGELDCSQESEEFRFFTPESFPPLTALAPPARVPIHDYL
ncbi:MAG: NUDIX domain-containing protein [Thermodesulfobacteriota bacterium]